MCYSRINPKTTQYQLLDATAVQSLDNNAIEQDDFAYETTG